MKKLSLVFFLLFSFLSCFTQSTIDTQLLKQGQQIDTILKKVSMVKVDIDSAKMYINTQKEKAAKIDKECIGCDIDSIEWVLIFSPIWLFVIALIIIRKKLKEFSLKDALTESELPKKIIANPEYTALNINGLANNAAISGILPNLIPPTIEVTAALEYPKSSSRYIALITSALTWIIVLCLSCFFIYQYIKTNKAPELTGLSSVLIALGIGVVPYAFNKISTAVK